MTDGHQPAEVGPWAKEKLGALEAYLRFYTKVLKNQRHWRTIFIDAFAGGGRARVRKLKQGSDTADSLFDIEPPEPEQQELIRGSPRVALELEDRFDTYVFIDADQVRVAELNELKTHYDDGRIIHVREGSAASQIDWVLSHNLTRDRYRGVAFLDPFGAHIEWRTIQALAATGVFEVLINLPLHMAINRLMKVDGAIPPTWRSQLDAFFPDGWWSEVYSEDKGLFAGTNIDVGPEKRPDAMLRLLRFYSKHLRDVFGHVSEPKLIRNTRNVPLYYLVWAGPHSKGREGANYVLSMGERVSLPRRTKSA
jgi:three-Cys-motif partner protein